jgi:hypothetical protein
MKARSFRMVERFEHFLLEFRTGSVEMLHDPAASRGDAHVVSPPVLGIGLALDQLSAFQFIDNGHRVAWVNSHDPAKVLLRERAMLFKRQQQAEVVGRQFVLAHHAHKAPSGLHPQTGQ